MREFHRPDNVRIDAARRLLQIDWEDGKSTEYDFEALRRACPCAICQGEGGYAGNMTLTRVLAPKEIELVEWSPVGRYGIQPLWADGHSTGIYTFKMLRAAAGLEP